MVTLAICLFCLASVGFAATLILPVVPVQSARKPQDPNRYRG